MKSIQQSTFQSQKLVYSAIHNQVDFVLFSGDIYDLEDRSVKAVQFKREMERLEKQTIILFMEIMILLEMKRSISLCQQHIC